MKWLSNHRWAALGFTASAAYWPFQLEGAFVPRWAVIAVGLPLVSRLDPRALPETMRIVLGSLLFICAISLLRTPSIHAGLGDLVFVLILSAAFVAGAALASLDDLMLGTGAGLGLSSILILLQYFGIWSPFPEGSVAPAGLFYNSEMLGEFAGLVAAWGIVHAMNGGGRRAGLVVVSSVIPLVISGSRVGMAAAAVGLVVSLRLRWRFLLPLIFVGCAAAIYALLGLDPAKLSSGLHRIILWGATVMAFTPLGNGLGWVSVAYPYEEFSHSDVLQALVELGLGGLGLALIPIAALRSKRGTNAENALFAAVLVEAFISFPLHFPACGFIAAIVAGYLVGTGPGLRDLTSGSGSRYEPRRLWRRYVAAANAGRGKSGGRAIPVRPVFAQSEAVRPGSTHTLGAI